MKKKFKDTAARKFLLNKIPTEPKSIILFPSFLNHKVMPNETNKDRYSIAFNIIPKGEFGDTTMKLYL